MKTVIKCKMCDKEFSIIGSNFFVKHIDVDSESLDLLILKCPHCNCEVIGQIDSHKTYLMLNELQNKMKVVSRWMSLGNKKTQRQSAQLKNLNDRLDREREMLKNKYKDFLVKEYNLDFYFDS